MAHSRLFMGAKLKPAQGLAAGLLAGAGMALVFSLGAALFGPGADTLWNTVAATFMDSDVITAGASSSLLVGLIIHTVVSVLLGVLFATSMDRLNTRDTLAVSIFYGFTIWVVFSIIFGRWINREVADFARTWWGLVSYLVYGLLLGVWANLRGVSPLE